MSLTVKAYLDKNGNHDAEIRRFAVPADVSTSYEYHVKKLASVFPSLRDEKFSISWKDSDGDKICINSDEELTEALGFMNDDSLLRLYIAKEDSSTLQTEGEIHLGVKCDGCDGHIRGPRFKCMTCPDYDLCQICERRNIHNHHNMLRFVKPVDNSHLLPLGTWFGHSPPSRAQCRTPGFHGPLPGQGYPGHPKPGEPFVPPPYFRRWMKQFMKRWHNKNSPDCAHDGSSEEEGKKQMKGQRKCQNKNKDRIEQKEEESPVQDYNMSKDTILADMACLAVPQVPVQQVEMADESAIVVEPELVKEAQLQPVQARKMDVGPGHNDEAAWTVVNNKASDKPESDHSPVLDATVTSDTTTVNVQPKEQTTSSKPVPAPSSPHVAQALHQMQCMGFNNDGGWLTRLLEDKDGDIIRVLDAIKPQQGRIRQVSGGTLA